MRQTLPLLESNDLLPPCDPVACGSRANTACQVTLEAALSTITQSLLVTTDLISTRLIMLTSHISGDSFLKQDLPGIALCREEPSSAGKAPLVRIDQIQQLRRTLRTCGTDTGLRDVGVIPIGNNPVSVLLVESRRLHVSGSLTRYSWIVIDLVLEISSLEQHDCDQSCLCSERIDLECVEGLVDVGSCDACWSALGWSSCAIT